MTAPRHASAAWDDDEDVTRALSSLDVVGEVPNAPVDGNDPLAAPVTQVSVPPTIAAPQRAHETPAVVSTPETSVPATGQTVLRRKRPTRRAGTDDGRTLRRDPRTRRKPVNAVPSVPYAEDAVPTVSSTGRMRPTRARTRRRLGMLLIILLLRLAALAMCALVVFAAAPALVGRLSLLRVVSAVSSLLPAQVAGLLVIPTPFDGAFRGDFALVALGCYVVDWLLTRLRARLRGLEA